MALTNLGKTWYDATQISKIIENDTVDVTDRYVAKTNLVLKDSGNTIVRNLRESDLEIPESDLDVVHEITARRRV